MARSDPRLDSIDIPDGQWCDSDGGGSRLHTSISIRGLGYLYLTAFRVARLCECGRGHGLMASTSVAEGMGCHGHVQEADTDLPYVREQYNEFAVAAAQQEPWDEMEIQGRRYVVFGCPGS